MTDLICKLETATEGTRELGDKVSLACGWRADGVWWHDPDGKRYSYGHQPNPAESVDDALALLPEGWIFSMTGGKNAAQWAGIAPNIWREDDSPEAEGGEESTAATPALALCAAIMKAKGHD